MKKVFALILVAAIALSLCACGAKTEKKAAAPEAVSFYKGKTLNVNIPGSAGGGTDIPTRLFFGYVDKELGCTSVPQNLNAAGGVVCYTQTAQAKADGLTIACTSCPVFLSSYLAGDLTYNPEADYEIIGGITESAQAICVGPNSPFNTLEELLAYAKDHPEDLCWEGTAATGVKQLIRISLQNAAGVTFRTLDTGGDNDLVVDLMGGHIDLAAVSISTAATYVKNGEIKALATTGTERSDFLPDVRTVGEIGYKVPIMGTTQIFITPKGVDAAVLKEMRDAFAKISATEEWKKDAKDHNLTPAFLSAEDAISYIHTTVEFLKGTGLYTK